MKTMQKSSKILVLFALCALLLCAFKAHAVPKALSAGDDLAIAYKLPLRKDIDISLYDLAGKKIKEVSFKEGMIGAKPGLNMVFLKKKLVSVQSFKDNDKFLIAGEADSYEILMNGKPFHKGKVERASSLKGLFERPLKNPKDES